MIHIELSYDRAVHFLNEDMMDEINSHQIWFQFKKILVGS